MPPRLHACIAPPELPSSVPPRRYAAARHQSSSSIPPRLQAYIAPPALHTSTFPHLHASTAPPVLRRFIPPFILVATPAACLRSPVAPYLHTTAPSFASVCVSRHCQAVLHAVAVQIPSKLSSFSSKPHQNFTPARLQRTSTVQYLLHARTAHASRLQSSRTPTSTSARLQHTSRAPELYTSLPPRPHTYITPPELHSSTPTCPQRASRAPELPSSIPPHLHARSTPSELPSSIPLCL